MSKLDRLLEDEKLHRFEGQEGVENLAIVARQLGYRDPMYMGQFSHKGCIGDLVYFLQDNPGAVEAVLEFIRENEHLWLDDYPDEDEDEDEEEDEEEAEEE